MIEGSQNIWIVVQNCFQAKPESHRLHYCVPHSLREHFLGHFGDAGKMIVKIIMAFQPSAGPFPDRMDRLTLPIHLVSDAVSDPLTYFVGNDS